MNQPALSSKFRFLWVMILIGLWAPNNTWAQVGPYEIYQTITKADGLAYETATAIAQDTAGVYWIGCPNGVQRYLFGSPVKHYPFACLPPECEGDSILSQQDLWVYDLRRSQDSLIATTGASRYHYQPHIDKWVRIGSAISTLFADSTVLSQLPLKQVKSLTLEAALIGLEGKKPNTYISKVLRTGKNRILAASNNGLYEFQRMRNGKWIIRTGEPIAYSSQLIQTIASDNQGNVHLGVVGLGVVILSNYTVSDHYKTLPNFDTRGAWGMHEKNELLYVCGKNDLLSTSLNDPAPLRYVESFNLDRINGLRPAIHDVDEFEGELVVAGAGGLFDIQGRPFQNGQHKEAYLYTLRSINNSLYGMGRGVLIDFTKGGVNILPRLEDNSMQYYDAARASHNRLWVATLKGVCDFDTQTKHGSYKIPKPNSSDTTTNAAAVRYPVIRVLAKAKRKAKDQDTAYAIALDAGYWTLTSDAAPAPISGRNRRVGSNYAAELDQRGRLWIGTNDGVSCYIPREDRWVHKSLTSGWPIGEHDQASSQLLSDGRLAFGGVRGVFIFNPDSVLTPPELPRPFLTQAALDFVELSPKFLSSTEIAYPAGSRQIDLTVGMPGVLDTFGIVLETRLVGYQNEWNQPNTSIHSYNNLDYGNYTFEARLRDRFSGEVSDVLRRLLKRPAPWYATWWARSIFVLLGGGCIAFVASSIVNQQLRRRLEKVELENRINAERVRIARDLHDNVGSTLTYLSSSLERMNAKSGNAASSEELASLEALTRETLWQLRETIWAANSTEVSIGEFSTRLAEYLRRVVPLAKPALLTFDLPTESVVRLAPGHGLYLFRIVQEAVNNTIKSAEATFISVELNVRAGDAELELLIVDDGRGFELDALPYTSGVHGIKERAAEIGAHATLSSATGEGTTWRIVLPIRDKPQQK